MSVAVPAASTLATRPPLSSPAARADRRTGAQLDRRAGPQVHVAAGAVHVLRDVFQRAAAAHDEAAGNAAAYHSAGLQDAESACGDRPAEYRATREDGEGNALADLSAAEQGAGAEFTGGATEEVDRRVARIDPDEFENAAAADRHHAGRAAGGESAAGGQDTEAAGGHDQPGAAGH